MKCKQNYKALVKQQPVLYEKMIREAAEATVVEVLILILWNTYIYIHGQSFKGFSTPTFSSSEKIKKLFMKTV